MAGDKSRWDEVDNLLETIGSDNGRLEDIRDGYSLLGGLYRQAWLRVNRPYWLENNLARYDKAAQLVDRARRSLDAGRDAVVREAHAAVAGRRGIAGGRALKNRGTPGLPS